MGRWCTILGVLISIGTAYLVMEFKSIMDYVQALFSFFIAPAVRHGPARHVLEARHAGGRLLGPAGGHGFLDRHVGLGQARSQRAGRSSRSRRDAKDMAENMYRALWSWIICVMVTVVVSYLSQAQDRRVSWWAWCTAAPSFPRKATCALYQRPIFWAGIVAVVFVVLNIIFW